jgi:hypothetical protein
MTQRDLGVHGGVADALDWLGIARKVTSDSIEAVIVRVVAQIKSAHFDLASDLWSASFDERAITFHRGRIDLDLVLERGHIALTIELPGYGSWGVGVWQACLDGTPPDPDPGDVEMQLSTFLRRADDIDRLIVTAAPEELADCLRSAGRWRFSERRRLGLIRAPREATARKFSDQNR